MDSVYDGIILGAGHNGLILQAYLGKAGLKVLTLERKGVAGGGLSTAPRPYWGGSLFGPLLARNSSISARR